MPDAPMPHRVGRRGRRGVALALALVLLSVFSVLAVVFAAAGDLSLQASHNFRVAGDARLAAESGLGFCTYLIESTSLPSGQTGQEMLSSLATALAGRLNGSANLQGQTVTCNGATISVPSVAMDGGGSFIAEITVAGADALRLRVVGRAASVDAPGGRLQRVVSVEFSPGTGGAFGYGIYAKGPVTIEQNFGYYGANDPSEACLFSAANGVAISIASGSIDGDVITYEPDATVNVGATVGGQICRTDILPSPRIDTSVFEPFATHIVDSGTDFSGGTFTNIRVRAGTNPEFGNNVAIQGVMYIEAPNNVVFSNNVMLTGVIVSQAPAPGASLADHSVYFKNNLTVHGLDELPVDPQFGTLRTMGGSAFLLPGFLLEFKNNFTTIAGTIAAQKIVAKNNLEGTVYGSIIVLGGEGLILKNNSRITVDRSRYRGETPGIGEATRKLVARFPSYSEE